MNFFELFIRRPVATTTLMAALVVFGFFAYRDLPVAELPSVDFPTINVSTSLPGADPETMAATVATPLERAFTQIPGVETMTSTSNTGQTNITLQFALSRDIDAAAQDVQNAIAQTTRQLPSALPNPPTLRKSNPSDAPIMFLALSATTVPLTKLDDYASTRIADRLSQLDGVAQVNVMGSKRYAARLYVNPNALTARGLSMSDLRSAIARANSNQPTGTLYGLQRSYTLSADGQLRTADEYNRLVIAQRDGAPVRFGDVGRAVDSIQNDKQSTEYNGRPAIVLTITRQAGSNTVEIAKQVHALFPELTAAAPGDARMEVIYDRSAFIAESILDVKLTLLLSIVLVVGVIWLFLHDHRATLISALALPSSLLGTFGVMLLCGFSLNNLTLLALTLSVGFVVDDAIVVLENIARHREKGEEPFAAAIRGTREIGFTVVSMTLSLVAVFIPILFMGGIIGRLFREFAVTVSIAILLSALVSLTLTPMLCARWLKAHDDSRQRGWIARGFERGFTAVTHGYQRSLAWSLRHVGLMLLLALAVLVGTVGMFKLVKTGFIPTQDTGIIFGSVQSPDGTTFEEMQALQRKAAKLVAGNANVESVSSSVGQGYGGMGGANTGRITVRLKPRADRVLSADEVIVELRKLMRATPQLQVVFQNPPAIRLGGPGNANLQYVIQGDNFDQLASAATSLQEALKVVPGIRDVNADLQLAGPQINIRIDRDRAASLGVDTQTLQDTLYAAYGAARISTIYTSANQYDVLLQLAPEFQQNIDALKAIHLRSSTGGLVPLSAVAQIERGVGPLAVTHYQQLPSATLSFDVLPGVSLGDITGPVENIAAQNLPPEVSGHFAGTAETFKQSLIDLPLLLAFSVLVIYMVLAILYEHFVHPITILTALPLAALGAVVSLWLTGAELNVFSFVGLILLVGLVKKNGIIMVDFAIARRRDGASAESAMLEACVVRFRPIMMTTAAAILGVLPIALGYGAGAESRQPLGIAVVGGLVTSQLLTLYITPAFYLAMERLAERRRKKEPASPSRQPA